MILMTPACQSHYVDNNVIIYNYVVMFIIIYTQLCWRSSSVKLRIEILRKHRTSVNLNIKFRRYVQPP